MKVRGFLKWGGSTSTYLTREVSFSVSAKTNELVSLCESRRTLELMQPSG